MSDEEKPPGEVKPAPVTAESEVTAEQLAKWAEVYGTQPRQLRRYIRLGREQNDPCPLGDPIKVPSWWLRRMKHRVPPKILHACIKAQQENAASPSAPLAEGGADSGAEPLDTPIDLDGASLDDGEEVKIARALVSSYRAKLSEALKRNPVSTEQVTTWNRHLKEALETLRKAKVDDRAQKEHSGHYIVRSVVEREIFEAVKLLASMRRAMGKLVAAELRRRLPDLGEAIIAVVLEVIESERLREDDLFRNLDSVKLEDVLRLAA